MVGGSRSSGSTCQPKDLAITDEMGEYVWTKWLLCSLIVSEGKAWPIGLDYLVLLLHQLVVGVLLPAWYAASMRRMYVSSAVTEATQLRVTLASLPLNTVERNTQFQSSIECTAKTSRYTNLLSRSRSFQELTGISVFLALYLYRSPSQSLTIRLSAVEESPLRMIPPADFRLSFRGYRVKDEFHIGRPSMPLYSTSHLRSGIFCRIFPWFIHLRCFRNGHCIRKLDMRLKFYLQLPLGLNSGFRQSLLHFSFDLELIWFD